VRRRYSLFLLFGIGGQYLQYELNYIIYNKVDKYLIKRNLLDIKE